MNEHEHSCRGCHPELYPEGAPVAPFPEHSAVRIHPPHMLTDIIVELDGEDVTNGCREAIASPHYLDGDGMVVLLAKNEQGSFHVCPLPANREPCEIVKRGKVVVRPKEGSQG